MRITKQFTAKTQRTFYFFLFTFYILSFGFVGFLLAACPSYPCYKKSGTYPDCHYTWKCNESSTCCNGQCCDLAQCKFCNNDSCESYCLEGEMCCDGECCPDSTICEQSLLGQPDNPEALMQLGWLSFSEGDWQESIFYFERGLIKLPDGSNKPTEVIYALARMYEKTGNKQKAEETYWQLLSLMNDENPQIQKVKSLIISLENKAGE